MKFGFIAMSALVFSTSVYAGKSESIKDYSAQVREAAESFTKLSKKAKGSKDVIMASDTFKSITGKFQMSEKDQSRIAQAIADGKSNIVTALYASMAAKELLDSQAIEINDADKGISSILKMAAVSQKGVASEPNLKLTADEMTDAGLALKKKTEYSIDMLSWTKEDADIHIAVMKKTSEIYETLKITPEEALILAIMEVKGVDKEAALKIARKLKDCV